MMKHQTNSPRFKSALGSLSQPSIGEIAARDFPPEVHSEWRKAGSVLRDAGLVDGRHLVLVFAVDYASLTANRIVPRTVIKYNGQRGACPLRGQVPEDGYSSSLPERTPRPRGYVGSNGRKKAGWFLL